MKTIEELIIAILQGLFEWLPISSSGQVMIVSTSLLGMPPEKAFSLAIWLHLGTMLAVLIKFRKEYKDMLLSFFPKYRKEKLSIKKRNWVVISLIGTACTALPLYFLFRLLISGFLPVHGDIITIFIAIFLLITGIVLITRKKDRGTKRIEDIDDIKLKKDSFISGLIQGTSILPGISRSGVTVATLLYEDYDQDSALRLSFIMSVPVVIASIGVDILMGNFIYIDPFVIIATTLVSFVVGYLSMEFLLKVAKKFEFGYFCIIYGAIALLVLILFLLI
ncbi:MAG: undecaprenyl-diphosphate phosphatase [Candidatus Lokiarchaeota archaeon]|nr:undecaprenyl-diphosphate phosphatase [Candidatus Lokiarchaeota archaeon]